MRACRSFFVYLFVIVIIFVSSCNKDDQGERLKGQLGITMKTTGTIDPDHKYLITFGDLLGDFEYENGVEIGANDNALLIMPRVGEIIEIYLSNIPNDCPDVSSSSSTGNQLLSTENPSDFKHPEAQYQSTFLVPLDGTAGELEFSIDCN